MHVHAILSRGHMTVSPQMYAIKAYFKSPVLLFECFHELSKTVLQKQEMNFVWPWYPGSEGCVNTVVAC